MNATGAPAYSAEIQESGCCSGKLYRYMTPSYFEHSPKSAGSLRSIRTAFEEQTTAHGIPNFSRARGTFKKCFWILVMLTMLGGLVYNVRGLVVSYLNYDVSVSISVTQEQQFVFPAVTICNLSPVKKSALASSPVQLRRKRALSSDPGNGTEPPAYCSNGWLLYNDSCYYFSPGMVDQPTAVNKCQSKSAQLTSINDQDELNFISSVILSLSTSTREYWIGLCKTVAWMTPSYWLDGSTSQFRPWGPTEPNDNTTCVRIDLSVFRDRECSMSYNYICKMRQGTTTEYPSTTAATKTSKTTTSRPSTTAKLTTSAATTTLETTEPPTTTTKAKTTTAQATTEATFQMTTTAVASTAKATSTIPTTPGMTSSTVKATSATPTTPGITTPTVKTTSTILTTPGMTSSTVKATSATPTTPGITTPTVKTTSTILTTPGMTSSTVKVTSTIPTTPGLASTTVKITPTLPTTPETTSPSIKATSTIPITSETTSPTAETTPTTVSTTAEITSPKEAATTTLQATSESASDFKQSDSTTSDPSTKPTTGAPSTTSEFKTNPLSTDSSSTNTSTVISTTITRPVTTTITESPSTSSPQALMETSFETTDLNEATISTPEVIPKRVRCCCRCCQWDADISAEFCALCVNDTMEISVSCASNREPPSTPATSPNFEAPSSISGSRFPDRPAYREDFLNQDKLTEDLASMPDEERSVLGFSVSDLIVDCQFDGTPCDLTRDFTEFYSNMYGNCFVFNSGWANYTEQTRMSSLSGPKHGLVLIANIQQDEYVDQVGDVAGVRIVVLPQNQIAFPEDDGITVSPGHVTSIGMLQTTVERQPEPYGGCTGTTDDRQRSVYSEKYQIEYSKNACLKTCYQRYVIERCQCADPYVPSYGKAFQYSTVPVCSTSNITQDDCKYEVIKQYANNTLLCDCPDRCSDKLFDLKTSMSAFPAKKAKDTICRRLEGKIGSRLSDKQFRENIAKLEIFFESFITKDISETPRYPLVDLYPLCKILLRSQNITFVHVMTVGAVHILYNAQGLVNLISDIGGVVGLWFGFAFMTFFEIFEFFTDIIVLMIEKCCKSGKSEKANKKATFMDDLSEERID